MEARGQAGRLSSGALGRALLPTLVLAAAGLFAYAALIGYHPNAGFETVPDETEAFFFEPGSSPLLIVLTTLWILFNRRYQIRDAYGQPALPMPAGLCLLTASGFFLWASYAGAPDLMVVSLIFMVLGSGALLGGAAGVRALWLPAVFMMLLLPAPVELVNHVVYPLQLFTAKTSVWILGVVGVPAAQLGDLILTESKIFQVIEACSGLRLIETLTMSGVLYAELFYRSRLQATLIVIVGPLIGFPVNQLRVLSLIANPYSNFAAVHTVQGIAMLVGGVLLLAVFDAVLSRVLPTRPSPRAVSRPRGNPTPRLVLLVVLLGALGTANLSISGWQVDEPLPTPLFQLPTRMGAWSVTRGLPLDREFMGSVGLGEWLHRRYEREDEWLEVFVGSDRRLQRRASLISEKTALPGSGWALLKRRLVELDEGGALVEELELRSRNERRLAYHWREGTEGLLVEALRSALALDQSPMRRPGRALVFRVSTAREVGEAGRAEAQRRLREFARMLQDFYQ